MDTVIQFPLEAAPQLPDMFFPHNRTSITVFLFYILHMF